MAKPKTQNPESKAPRRPRRLNRAYRPHAEQIARIYLECGESALQTVERVHAEIPVLASMSPNAFFRWRGNTEWESALKAAKLDVAFENDFKPRVRGQKFLRWARDAAKRLAGEHEQIVKDSENAPDRKLRAAAGFAVGPIEGRIVKLNEAIRAEEKHQDELQDKAVRRDMRTFAKNFVELFATYLTDEGQRKLLDVQRDPGALMKGIE